MYPKLINGFFNLRIYNIKCQNECNYWIKARECRRKRSWANLRSRPISTGGSEENHNNRQLELLTSTPFEHKPQSDLSLVVKAGHMFKGSLEPDFWGSALDLKIQKEWKHMRRDRATMTLQILVQDMLDSNSDSWLICPPTTRVYVV
jgi:hypothetical protein